MPADAWRFQGSALQCLSIERTGSRASRYLLTTAGLWLRNPTNDQPHYNIAPTDPVDVVRPTTASAVELASMRWGLVPSWWKKPLKQVPASFNARAESVADKPMFRDAFKRHRCVIPASGYYEWLKKPDGRQPYFISAADRGVLSLTGGRIRRPA